MGDPGARGCTSRRAGRELGPASAELSLIKIVSQCAKNNAHINAPGYKLVGIRLDQPGKASSDVRPHRAVLDVRTWNICVFMNVTSRTMKPTRTATCFLATSALDLSDGAATPTERERAWKALFSLLDSISGERAGRLRIPKPRYSVAVGRGRDWERREMVHRSR
ncbi:hypothetical protein KM043_005102 [Ampulex compressa]|nr:hypothetical protein KM043_005102 [Ampulex compressa]